MRSVHVKGHERGTMTTDAAIPVIQVTEEPISEPVPTKKDAVEAENDVLQMIIDQQKSKRKKFVFRDKQDGQMSDDKSMSRTDSSDCDYSSPSAGASPCSTATDQN
ncbi:uncharacterized protein LOC129583261 [Paramacrobiotus metropolitanus]|uniref:uncharacterized protein LOC129583261 n=1 Tax=Paramacrobiotus metropolitanus TaxID=2943436 RepID=UPI002445F81F|nr:uncharacterized protein LOC129583261 [Paramacrobiotus metropolitanus]